ncbi:osmotically inducible protein C [Anoxybacillus flavithermus]|uniref:Osmotically inducible protein C n=1 Tax=Anoxybacillus flavithermus TaxID=33934 RepID=A0A2G5RP17_9BACL|nr:MULTISPECIES: OsmC family protein [Anoxybacillus]KFZ42344.1 osmotically inducible protein C [Anoxybacillus sp. KU2-6(11)]PIC04401.1 osmotically inducible protein C [Anoxybacillus flavithermus]
MNKMAFIVQATVEGVTTYVKAGKHEFVIDEAKQMGGRDLGANPLQMVLGALAACENVTARVVAKEMNFDLQDMTFVVKGQIDPRGFMGDPSARPYFESVSVEVAVKTNENEERVQQLKEKVEARCPVYTMVKAAGVQMNDQWYKA